MQCVSKSVMRILKAMVLIGLLLVTGCGTVASKEEPDSGVDEVVPQAPSVSTSFGSGSAASERYRLRVRVGGNKPSGTTKTEKANVQLRPIRSTQTKQEK